MDSQTESQVLTRLGDELEGRTLLVVTHRTPFLKLVDRLILMDRGKVIADGPRDEVLAQINRPGRPGTPATAQQAGAGLIKAGIKAGGAKE